MENILEKLPPDQIYQVLLLQRQDSIPSRPVLFYLPPILPSSYRRLVLFDYHEKKVLIFGHGAQLETNMYADWSEWNGIDYWRAIGEFFGWDLGLEERSPQVIAPNWVRVNVSP
jgi:hypothetical protein